MRSWSGVRTATTARDHRVGYGLVVVADSDALDSAVADLACTGATIIPVRADLKTEEGVTTVYAAVGKTAGLWPRRFSMPLWDAVVHSSIPARRHARRRRPPRPLHRAPGQIGPRRHDATGRGQGVLWWALRIRGTNSASSHVTASGPSGGRGSRLVFRIHRLRRERRNSSVSVGTGSARRSRSRRWSGSVQRLQLPCRGIRPLRGAVAAVVDYRGVGRDKLLASSCRTALLIACRSPTRAVRKRGIPCRSRVGDQPGRACYGLAGSIVTDPAVRERRHPHRSSGRAWGPERPPGFGIQGAAGRR